MRQSSIQNPLAGVSPARLKTLHMPMRRNPPRRRTNEALVLSPSQWSPVHPTHEPTSRMVTDGLHVISLPGATLNVEDPAPCEPRAFQIFSAVPRFVFFRMELNTEKIYALEV